LRFASEAELSAVNARVAERKLRNAAGRVLETTLTAGLVPEGEAIVFASAPSGTGVQVSFGGVLGVMLAAQEGVELNLLGLSAGVDFWPPALKLPGVGRIGFPEHRPAASN
jgi:hypothetical protein